MPDRGRRDDVLEVDVLDVSDLRFAGGTAGSIGEEVKAQAAAGYTSGLLHLDGPLVARATPVNPGLRRCVDTGLARLVLPHERVRTKVVVVRHPAVLQHAEIEIAGVETGELVVVANAAPRDIDGYEHYRVDAVREAALRHFGVEPRWAPIGPLVRDSLAAELRGQRVIADDWVNIIDVDAWSVSRPGWVSDRPVIGRHSRDNAQKWPADRETLHAVYPTDGTMRVRVLGGAAAPAELLGELPESWEVLPFGSISPREFLAGLDFFVYYHNPRWVEAFGRTILEALATGVVAILPPHFAKVFGDAAVYAAPGAVRSTIERFYADRAAYERQADTGQQVARRRFGYEAHAARLGALIGQPSAGQPSGGQPSAGQPSAGQPSAGQPSRSQPSAGQPSGQRPSRPVPAPPGTASRRILMISSNGSGMGHLTRLLAMARRYEHEPYFLSLSQAVPVVAAFGYPYEYLPSMNHTGLVSVRWHRYFAARVSEVVDRIKPAAVVFDGTYPYDGIRSAQAVHPELPWVWSRRGMWYPGVNRDQLAKADWFDLVIEPGDFAAPVDRGATADAPATRVGPITLLDRDEIDDRRAARHALGFNAQPPMALVTLGAGNINDPSSTTRVVLEALRSLDLKTCVTQPEIAKRSSFGERGVAVVSEYPLSRRYAAFDVAVSAAGYNSFHELLRFGVPTLFIPNLQTSLDDQRARARYAADQGLAHCLEEPDVASVRTLVEDLMEHGASMVGKVPALDPGNGAAAAAAEIEQVAVRRVG